MGFKVRGVMKVLELASSQKTLDGFKVSAAKSGTDLEAVAAKAGLKLEANEKVLYFRAKMMGYDLPNGNGDMVPRQYAAHFGPSFIGKQLNVNHQPDPEHIIGRILTTFHVEQPITLSAEDERIIGKNVLAGLEDAEVKELQLEGICMIDRTTVLGDDIAKKLLSGVLTMVSQEAYTEFCQCSVCGHKMQGPRATVCGHLDYGSLMVEAYQVEGRPHKILAYKEHHNPVGEGLAIVNVGAYSKADIMDLVAKAKTGAMKADEAMGLLAFQESVFGTNNLIHAAKIEIASASTVESALKKLDGMEALALQRHFQGLAAAPTIAQDPKVQVGSPAPAAPSADGAPEPGVAPEPGTAQPQSETATASGESLDVPKDMSPGDAQAAIDKAKSDAEAAAKAGHEPAEVQDSDPIKPDDKAKAPDGSEPTTSEGGPVTAAKVKADGDAPANQRIRYEILDKDGKVLAVTRSSSPEGALKNYRYYHPKRNDAVKAVEAKNPETAEGTVTAAKSVSYRGYTIEPSGDNFYVKDPKGARAFGETPSSVETAKKWIDQELAGKTSKVTAGDDFRQILEQADSAQLAAWITDVEGDENGFVYPTAEDSAKAKAEGENYDGPVADYYELMDAGEAVMIEEILKKREIYEPKLDLLTKMMENASLRASKIKAGGLREYPFDVDGKRYIAMVDYELFDGHPQWVPYEFKDEAGNPVGDPRLQERLHHAFGSEESSGKVENHLYDPERDAAVDKAAGLEATATLFRGADLASSYWTLSRGTELLGRFHLAALAGGDFTQTVEVEGKKVTLSEHLVSEAYGKDLVAHVRRFGADKVVAALSKAERQYLPSLVKGEGKLNPDASAAAKANADKDAKDMGEPATSDALPAQEAQAGTLKAAGSAIQKFLKLCKRQTIENQTDGETFQEYLDEAVAEAGDNAELAQAMQDLSEQIGEAFYPRGSYAERLAMQEKLPEAIKKVEDMAQAGVTAAYKSDEDIAKEFEGLKVTETKVWPPKPSGAKGESFQWVMLELEFPAAGEHVGGGREGEGPHYVTEQATARIDGNGKVISVSVDNWYPENVRNQVVEEVKKAVAAGVTVDENGQPLTASIKAEDPKFRYTFAFVPHESPEALQQLKDWAVAQNIIFEEEDRQYVTILKVPFLPDVDKADDAQEREFVQLAQSLGVKTETQKDAAVAAKINPGMFPSTPDRLLARGTAMVRRLHAMSDKDLLLALTEAGLRPSMAHRLVGGRALIMLGEPADKLPATKVVKATAEAKDWVLSRLARLKATGRLNDTTIGQVLEAAVKLGHNVEAFRKLHAGFIKPGSSRDLRELSDLGYMQLDSIEDRPSDQLNTGTQALLQSNYNAAIKRLPEGGEEGAADFKSKFPEDEYPGDVVYMHGFILVYPGTKAMAEAEAISSEIDNYPLLDEEGFSDIEMEIYDHDIETWALTDAERQLGYGKLLEDILDNDELALYDQLSDQDKAVVDAAADEPTEEVKHQLTRALHDAFSHYGEAHFKPTDLEGVKSAHDAAMEALNKAMAESNPGSDANMRKKESEGQQRLPNVAKQLPVSRKFLVADLEVKAAVYPDGTEVKIGDIVTFMDHSSGSAVEAEGTVKSIGAGENGALILDPVKGKSYKVAPVFPEDVIDHRPGHSSPVSAGIKADDTEDGADDLADELEDAQDEDREPDPEIDIVIGEDDLSAYHAGKEIVSITRDEADEDEDALDKAIAAWMDQNKYWPDVWWISDHGNPNIVTERVFKFTKQGLKGSVDEVLTQVEELLGNNLMATNDLFQLETRQGDQEVKDWLKAYDEAWQSSVKAKAGQVDKDAALSKVRDFLKGFLPWVKPKLEDGRGVAGQGPGRVAEIIGDLTAAAELVKDAPKDAEPKAERGALEASATAALVATELSNMFQGSNIEPVVDGFVFRAYWAGKIIPVSVSLGVRGPMVLGAGAEAFEISAKTPEGFEHVVKQLKKEGKVDNPWALANWMKNQGYKPSKKK